MLWFKLASIAVVALIASPANPPAPPAEKPVQVATTCFFKSERQPSGSNTKICYYDCLGNLHAITIPSTSLCPLTIND